MQFSVTEVELNNFDQVAANAFSLQYLYIPYIQGTDFTATPSGTYRAVSVDHFIRNKLLLKPMVLQRVFSQVPQSVIDGETYSQNVSKLFIGQLGLQKSASPWSLLGIGIVMSIASFQVFDEIR